MSQQAMLARDKALELPTSYVPPPGNPLEHHAAGFAQIMCSAVFITGLDPDFAAENVGYFTAPYAERAKLGKPVIDRVSKTESFPQHALFDKIGVRSMVIETDPFGNLLTQGYDLACARDWARLGNLYLQDGVWNGQRILPRGFVEFVSTPAPAWVADGRPIYGGFFWINGDHAIPIPKSAYYMAGAGGQFTMIIPSHDLVVVRLGHFKGDEPGTRDFYRALSILVKAVPTREQRQL
jgi:CubicO group peptidase (beta-lactamase class C family)